MKRSTHSRLATLGVALVLLYATGALAQSRQEIRIPDIMGYKTLKCDLHMHTVFSDGTVWPTVRVDEAWREGLDVISITDHIEYQPFRRDIPTNHNRPYEIARSRARERGILLIRGAEITRETPPGHFNAIFLDDVDPLDTEDLMDAMEAADKQGAFIFWNHPDWKPEHIGWFDIHTTLYEKKYLRGIEVVNGRTYSANAHRWVLEKDLTFIGTSDIHGPSLLERSTPEQHRAMTLVFARERTIPAVKDALVAGRTAIWFEDKIIGRREYLEALLEAMVRITDIEREKKQVRFTLRNNSDVPLDLQQTRGPGPRSLNLPPNSTTRVRINVSDPEKPVELSYVVRNFLIEPKRGLPVSFTIAGQFTVEFEIETEIVAP